MGLVSLYMSLTSCRAQRMWSSRSDNAVCYETRVVQFLRCINKTPTYCWVIELIYRQVFRSFLSDDQSNSTMTSPSGLSPVAPASEHPNEVETDKTSRFDPRLPGCYSIDDPSRLDGSTKEKASRTSRSLIKAKVSRRVASRLIPKSTRIFNALDRYAV